MVSASARAHEARGPNALQEAFTQSLLSHRQPRAYTVGVPHRCRGCCSVSTFSVGHTYTHWTVAPSSELKSAAIVPPTRISAAAVPIGIGRSNAAEPPITPAPATAASVPRTVTPPDVPRGHRFAQMCDESRPNRRQAAQFR